MMLLAEQESDLLVLSKTTEGDESAETSNTTEAGL